MPSLRAAFAAKALPVEGPVFGGSSTAMTSGHGSLGNGLVQRGWAEGGMLRMFNGSV